MIVVDERRETEGQGQKQSPNVSSSVVCVGEEFPSQQCVATSMELQADHHTLTSTITSTIPATNTSSSGKTVRTCRVCGDKAKSMHFGGLSCDSCKAFFRRAVHSDTYTNFTCPYDGTCIINITSRKCCQYCRYQKCLSIGMERSWVMSEEDRHQMMRQRAERKAKVAAQDTTRRTLKAGRRELVPFEPDPNTMLSYMTATEWEELEQAVRNYRQAYTAVPHSQSGEGWEGDGTSLHIVSMFSTVVRRFAHFARLFPEFSELPSEDQSRLLRYGILEMSLIRGIQSLHTNSDCWPPLPHPPPPPPPPHTTTTTTTNTTAITPRAAPRNTKQLVSSELYEMHMKFVQSMRELGVDEPVLLLLLLVVLFSSDRPGLQTAATAAVQTRQDHYLLLLRKYLNWRHGPNNAPILYPRLLLKLTDLRELNDQHTEYHLRMARQEIVEIQTQLGCLNLNQYTEWPGLIPSHRTPSAPHVDTQGSLLGEEEQMNKNPPSSTQTFKDHSSPLSSIILASLDLECLINSPTIQRLILHQFQRSVVNVLGLAGLFPETRQPPSNQQSVTQCSNPSPSPQDTSHPQIFAPQKVSQQAPTFSVQQGPPLQVSQVSELASHLEYLTCPPHPGQGTTQQQQQPQEPQQQTFHQLEQQFMSGIAKSGGDFEEHGYQQQLQQHQQAFHQNPHQQIAPKHSLVMEQDNYGLVIPKEEPLGSPTSHVTHYNHPLMYDDLPCHSPLTQDTLEALETPRSFLDAHEAERFQHIQEPREMTSFESTVPQFQKVMSGQFPYHSSPNMIHPSHTSHIPIQQIPGQQAQFIPTPAHHGIPQGYQTPPQPHHTPGAPHPQLNNPGYNLPSSQTFNFESEVESGCMSPDSTYPEAVSYSPLPQQHFTAHVGFAGGSQHRTPPHFNTATATPSPPPPLHHFQSHATPHHLHHHHHHYHSQFGQKVASL